MENAVVQADSRGDIEQAIKILTGILKRDQKTASPDEVAEVEADLGELREHQS